MYTSYFGFSQQPFANADTRLLLHHPQVAAGYEQLSQALTGGGKRLLLTGPAGIGKATLLRRLRSAVQDRVRWVDLWNAHLEWPDLLAWLAGELGAPGPVPPAELTTLAGGRPLVVVVHDAQLLPDSSLDGLNTLPGSGGPSLTVLLAGPPELEQRLGPALAAGLDLHCRLEPWSREEMRDYVRTRLTEAGREDGLEVFEPAALDKGLDLAEGLPRRADLIFNQALLLTYLNSEARVPARFVRRVSDNRAPAPAPVSSPLAAPLTAPAAPRSEPAPPTPPAYQPPPAEPASPPVVLQAADPDPEPSAQTDDLPPLPQDPFVPRRAGPHHHPRSSHRPRPRRRFPVVLSLLLLMGAGGVAAAWYLDLPLDPRRIDWSSTVALLERLPRLTEEPAPAEPARPPESPMAVAPPEQSPAPPVTPQVEAADPSPPPEKPDPVAVAEQAREPMPVEIPASPETVEGPGSEQEAGGEGPATLTETAPAVESEPETLAVETESETPAIEAMAEPPPLSVEQAAAIATLLESAQGQMAAMRYTIPAGDNAMESYRQVLEIDPDNEAALAGIETIKSDFMRWAEYARQRGEIAKARRHLETALNIDPQDGTVREQLEALP